MSHFADRYWRLIPLWRGSGQLQMAIDRWLFEQCHRAVHPPVLRFYEWEPAAISLGYHQKQWPSHWQSLCWAGQPIDLVRRPTGGRAVLHAGDLTYGLVLPRQSGRRRETYEYICQFLIQGWQCLNVDLRFGVADRGAQREVNCFKTATPADLVTIKGEKLIGSAQAWQGQTVLQQGSIQLQVNRELQQQVFAIPEQAPILNPCQYPTSTVIAALTQAAAQHFNVTFEVKPLTPEEWEQIHRVLNEFNHGLDLELVANPSCQTLPN